MKASRQAKILEIVDTSHVETQEELMSRLEADGFHVTQATISRDIKELKLVKISGEDGSQYYQSVHNLGSVYTERIHRVFKESVLTVDVAYFMVVVRTLPAMAQAAALAIDALDYPEIVGVIAGDDTIFVAVRDENATSEIAENFRKLMRDK